MTKLYSVPLSLSGLTPDSQTSPSATTRIKGVSKRVYYMIKESKTLLKASVPLLYYYKRSNPNYKLSSVCNHVDTLITDVEMSIVRTTIITLLVVRSDNFLPTIDSSGISTYSSSYIDFVISFILPSSCSDSD